MTVTDAEIEAVRFHLGYGQLSAVAVTYTRDGFLELFHNVIQPNLVDIAETTATTAISVGEATVTPVSMTSIVPFARLYVDVGDDLEVVAVRSVTVSTFTAKFTKAHPATGYPVQVECGTSRLRQLLWSVDKIWQSRQSSSITQTAGIKQLGNGEIEWFGATDVLDTTTAQYVAIVNDISSLVRVMPAWNPSSMGNSGRLEAY